MKYLNKIVSGRLLHTVVCCGAALLLMALTSCEGSELYSVNAPDWIAAKVDSIKNSQTSSVVTVTPNPTVLGASDNTTPWWTVFTDDIKAEPGKTYQISFINYGGSSNWNNFVIILRNETKDFEYGVLRADNWGWGTGWTGEELAQHCVPSGGQSDWGTWLKAMSRAKCIATIVNNGDGSADVKVTMVGADGVTYKQDYIGLAVNKDDLYFAFTVDNCHLEFGELTDVPDSEPASMTIQGAPRKVLQGTAFEEAFANVSAEVKFENDLTTTVSATDLTLQSVPDMNSLGTKTLVAVFNKTYLGNNSTKPLVATVEFDVVDKMFTCIGKTDNTSGFRAEATENFKVAPGQTYVNYFTNYTDGVNNWDNFIIQLCKADGTEYCFVRADNWGAGGSYWDGCQSCDWNWENFKVVLNGAKVTTYITNNGDGTADIKAVVIGSDGKTYTQKYTGLKNIDPNDMCFNLSMEKGHLEFDYVIGAEDNTSGFRAIATPNVKIEAGQTFVNRFINTGDGAANWNNFIIQLCKADGTEYCFVRADNWGAGGSYWDGCQSCDYDWGVFASIMDGAKVTTYITNNGDGTADIKAVVEATGGKTFTQNYKGLKNIDSNDLYYNLSMEKAHLVFE
jgi:hypothetical protein